jgi:predicted RNA-binding Zn-ribbon protein involved in translation (DUF1610 family)
VLNEIKKQQEQGIVGVCPRCGQNTMDPEIHRNALSRYEDIYICNACGFDEAYLDFLDIPPLHITGWACFKKPRD